MFKIYKKQGEDLYDFTDICGELSLGNSSSELSEKLSFNIQGKFLNEADIILLYEDNKKIYEGIVISVEIEENTSSISSFDFGWYLNKNEDSFQFKDTVSNCIIKVLNAYNIPIGSISNINVIHENTHRGTLDEIIKKLIEYATINNGIKYNWQMRENKFYLEEEGSNPIVFNTSLFQVEGDILNFMKEPKIKRSIENLKNAVKVINEEDNKISVLAYQEDSSSIAKYGKIQKLETLSKDEKGTAGNVAINQLKLLNKVENTLSVTLPGIIDCRSNKVLKFDDDILGIKGNYKIISCNHKITPSSHLMSLELELI